MIDRPQVSTKACRIVFISGVGVCVFALPVFLLNQVMASVLWCIGALACALSLLRAEDKNG